MKKRTAVASKKIPSLIAKRASFPVVGIGGSAGGLEAFKAILGGLSAKPCMAFVFIMHLAPEHKSLLAELLVGSTPMHVQEVRSGMSLEVDHVYVLPANAHISLRGSKLMLQTLKGPGLRMPVDGFFRSLAEERGSGAIGVILSGTATDGTLGAEAIKAVGGIVFAQDEKTAQYDGMPHSAIAAGCVDFIGSPQRIASELERIAKHPLSVFPPSVEAGGGEMFVKDKGVEKVLGIVRSVTGLDFTHYKAATIHRRIARRMILLKQKNLKAYALFLRGDKNEVEKLYDDLLINVTGFFRDPKVFRTLKARVLPAILKAKAKDQGVRIWVPGCASGEEAYSIAMSLLEVLGGRAHSMPVQIFATDVSARSIQKARQGLYGPGIQNDLTPERLKRFFTKLGNGYQVSKQLREMCVFSRHNAFRDPPFSRLDLISCRNLLIYLQPVFQKKMFDYFHYGLLPGGFLLLGNSESAAGYSGLFHVWDRQKKMFVNKPLAGRPEVPGHVPWRKWRPEIESGLKEKVPFRSDQDAEIAAIVDRAVLGEYASCGVLIDGRMEVVHFRGHTGRYLESASGKPSLNLFKLMREGLAMPLQMAIRKARETRRTATDEAENVRSNGRRIRVQVTVIPVKAGTPEEQLFLVLFGTKRGGLPGQAPKGRRSKALPKRSSGNDEYLRVLQKELAETRAYLRTVMEEQEGANEELKTANEEILSANEELQSTNEELETSKEELQSNNEELTTANDELQSRNEQISLLNNDLTNLLSSINMPLFMLGRDLVIRRITPQAEKVLNVLPSDVGRPIHKIRLNVNIPDLEKILSEVMEFVRPETFEVEDREGRWFSVYVRPYRTEDHKIDGVVMIFIDITKKKDAEEALAKLANAKSKFTSTVSHELRSPLATIKEATNLVLEGMVGPVNDEQKDLLGTAKENIERLGRLVNNVLVYQKMEAGKMGYDPRENDLNEVVRAAHRSAALFAGDRNADLVMELGGDLPKLKFDRDKIFQVLMNLMANALKYSECGRVVIRTQRENEEVHVSVRDSG
ncbi:MAG: chemotaxis protein CheB, partial [Candidatus Omnitrophota bacterium]